MALGLSGHLTVSDLLLTFYESFSSLSIVGILGVHVNIDCFPDAVVGVFLSPLEKCCFIRKQMLMCVVTLGAFSCKYLLLFKHLVRDILCYA